MTRIPFITARSRRAETPRARPAGGILSARPLAFPPMSFRAFLPVLLILPTLLAGCTATEDGGVPAGGALTGPIDTVIFAAPDDRERASPFGAFEAFPARIVGLVTEDGDIALDQATDFAGLVDGNAVEKFDDPVAIARGRHTITGVRVEATGPFTLKNGESVDIAVPDPIRVDPVAFALPGSPEVSFLVLWFTIDTTGESPRMAARAEAVSTTMKLATWWQGNGEVLVRLAAARDGRSVLDRFATVDLGIAWIGARTTGQSEAFPVGAAVDLATLEVGGVDLGVVTVPAGRLDRINVGLNLTGATLQDGSAAEVSVARGGTYFAGSDGGAAYPDVVRGKRVTATFVLGVAEDDGSYFLQSRPDLSG